MSKYIKKKDKKDVSSIKKIAESRINDLFNEAKKVFVKDKTLSKRYIELSKKISTKYRTKIPKEYKKQHCKKCNNYLMPGKNATVRINNGKITYHCKECNHISRMPLKKN